MIKEEMINQEHNPFKRAFIWIWYHDMFRLFFLLFPSYMIILIPFLKWIELDPALIRNIALFTYVIMFMLGLTFNDYTNLRKIGLDVYRRKL